MTRAPRPTRRSAAEVAPRWRRAEPAQARSRETHERFALAAEELLRTRPFEEIPIQAIVRRAGRPVGSFYARFSSKDALLPVLYERYHDGLEATVTARLARSRWEGLDFPVTIAAVVDVVIGLYMERIWLIRALALFTRMRPESLPADLVERRKKVYDRFVAVLLPHRAAIRHADPEAAIRFGLFLVTAVAREKLLFTDAPHSRVTPIGRRALRRELIRVFHSYLVSEALE